MEGAEARIVLRACFPQADVALDDLDDIGVVFDVLGKVGHGRVCNEDTAGMEPAGVETVSAEGDRLPGCEL